MVDLYKNIILIARRSKRFYRMELLCSILLHCWIYITILQKPEMRFLIRHSIISKVGYGYLHRYTLNI